MTNAPAGKVMKWHLEENGLAGYGDNGPNFIIEDEDGEEVARLPHEIKMLDGGNPAQTKYYREGKAAALLIAAAPDLLAALEAVVRIADRKTDEFDAARAALASAKGEK